MDHKAERCFVCLAATAILQSPLTNEFAGPRMLKHALYPRVIDMASLFEYPLLRPGRPGAAKPCEPRQGRKAATVRKCLWVPPVSCPDIFATATMPRWLTTLLLLIIGIALGLVYGWVLNPIDYVNTTPGSLRADYRADYVLMVAESYQADQDADLAARRLALLGSQAPGVLAGQALEDARKVGFAEADVILIQKLTTVMQAWQPSFEGSVP